MKTYYFPINSISLAHYLGTAIIKPAKYFYNKPYDIQDRYKDFLLFTNKLGTQETDCCLEIVFTDDEAKDLIDVKGGWFLYDVKPLPITRIRKIYFSDKNKKETTITNIRMSTAYVPENLAEIHNFKGNSSKSIVVPADCSGVEQEEKLVKYDRFLGALALMKTAGESYMNYSQNYITTLSFFNTLIKQQINKINNPNFKDNYQGIFDSSKGFEHVIPYLNKTITEDVLNIIASENNQEINKDRITRVIDIDSINDTWTYTIAVLNSYGVGDEARRKRVDGLIQSHFSELKKEKAEGVALCYGYNRGYSAFTKDYGIIDKVSFKYKLESQLDYYTIESVYQYVFNGVVSYSFPYLDNWCPKHSNIFPTKKTDYVILDEVIVGKKKAKVFSEEWWNGLLPRFNKEFATLSKPIFVFFQIIMKELIEDLYDEQNENYIIMQKKLDENIKQINSLKNQLVLKTKENYELQQRLNSLGKHSFVQYNSTEEQTPQNIASEPKTEYGPKNNSLSDNYDLENKTKEELIEIAKKHGIKVSKKSKKEELYRLLANYSMQKSNDLFS